MFVLIGKIAQAQSDWMETICEQQFSSHSKTLTGFALNHSSVALAVIVLLEGEHLSQSQSDLHQSQRVRF